MYLHYTKGYSILKSGGGQKIFQISLWSVNIIPPIVVLQTPFTLALMGKYLAAGDLGVPKEKKLNFIAGGFFIPSF